MERKWIASGVAALLMASISAHAEDKISVVDEGAIGQEWTIEEGGKFAIPSYPDT